MVHHYFKKAIKTALLIVLFQAFIGCQGLGVSAPDGNVDGVLLGVFHEGAQLDLAPVKEIEKKTAKKMASVMWYLDWSTNFPTEDAQRVHDAGYMPHITWEPWFFDGTKKIDLDDILQGKWDEYIRNWASEAAAFGKPMLLRWGHEFNGDWYPWSLPQNGKNPARYSAAYKKIHGMFTDAGADNVLWIWCMNANSVPNEPWNDPLKAFPGIAYVDWIGIDGYNFSGSDSFKDIFAKIYSKVVQKTNKPIMIAEFATGGNGDTKAQWIKQMGEDLVNHFPAIRAITWFDINKELDWRLLVDEKTTEAAKEVFASDYFLSDPRLFGPIVDVFPSRRADYLANLDSLIPKVQRQEALADFQNEDMSDLAPWNPSAPIKVVSETGKDDLAATLSFQWSSDYFYFQADITDDVPAYNNKSGVNIWNGDCIEICIGLDEKADEKREYFTPLDFQLGFSPGYLKENTSPSAWAWGKLNKAPEGVELKVTPTEKGYLFLGRIPWSSLSSDFEPAKGMKLGFDFAIDDSDDSGDRESQTIWNGDSSFYSNPSQWGVLVLN